MKEEISQLKNCNQNLKDNIKKFEDNEESSYRSDNDLEEDIKSLNKPIMDKDDELAQIQRKIKKVKNQRYVDISNRRKNSNKSMTTLKRSTSQKFQKSMENQQAIPKNYFD